MLPAGSFPGLDQALGDVADLDVAVLGDPAQDLEGLLRGDLVALHEDALCLAQDGAAEAIRSFGLDALTGAVPLNVDLDVVLSVLAHTVCAALRRRIPGYATATPDTLQRRFLSTGGTIHNHRDHTTIRLGRRTYSPHLRQADLPATIQVPWWGGRILRYEYA